MNYQLHKLLEGFIITDSLRTPDLKKGELCLDEYNQVLPFVDLSIIGLGYGNIKRVIAQQDQIDFSALSEEEQKEIGWFDVEKLALDSIGIVEKDVPDWKEWITDKDYNKYQGFIEGFQEAQELLSDRRFTLEDLKQMFLLGKQHGLTVAACIRNGSEKPDTNENIEECIKFLSQPKSWSVELEMGEYRLNSDGEPIGFPDMSKPKLTGSKVKILKLL